MGLKNITKTSSNWAVSTSKKWDFSLKMRLADLQNCASCVGGEHIFRKFVKKNAGKWKMEAKDLGWQVWWLYEGAWYGQKAEMLKIIGFHHYLLKGHGCHEEIRQMNNPASRAVLGRFDIEKVRKIIKTALGRSWKLCFPCGRGADFQKKNENMLPENEKCN